MTLWHAILWLETTPRKKRRKEGKKTPFHVLFPSLSLRKILFFFFSLRETLGITLISKIIPPVIIFEPFTEQLNGNTVINPWLGRLPPALLHLRGPRPAAWFIGDDARKVPTSKHNTRLVSIMRCAEKTVKKDWVFTRTAEVITIRYISSLLLTSWLPPTTTCIWNFATGHHLTTP